MTEILVDLYHDGSSQFVETLRSNFPAVTFEGVRSPVEQKQVHTCTDKSYRLFFCHVLESKKLFVPLYGSTEISLLVHASPCGYSKSILIFLYRLAGVCAASWGGRNRSCGGNWETSLIPKVNPLNGPFSVPSNATWLSQEKALRESSGDPCALIIGFVRCHLRLSVASAVLPACG